MWNKLSLTIMFLLLAASLWYAFAPVQVGGQVAYVIIDGSSMEPDFQRGDLIVARHQEGYAVGERVVYTHPDIGYVFHRIVAEDEGRFILQGDGNSWLDSYQPTEDEIIGRHWVRIPQGGKIVRTLRRPAYFALLTVIMGLMGGSVFLLGGQPAAKGKRTKKMDKENSSSGAVDPRLEILLGTGVVALIGLILGAFAFTRPTTKMVDAHLAYTHQGQLTYSARDTEDVYDSEQIQTGEPVFLRLTCDVDMQLSYRLTSGSLAPADVSAYQGSYQILAQVSHENGWNRTFPLTAETGFSGTSFSAATQMDLCAVQEMIRAVEEKTGVSNRWYQLTVLPEVKIAGVLQGKSFEDEYQPAIAFQMDSNLMRLPQSAEELVPSQEGEVPHREQVKNTLAIFGQEISVTAARWLAAVMMGGALLASIWPAQSLYRDWKESAVSRIQVQYHPMLVDVEPGSLAAEGHQIVEVTSFQDLSKMAERYGAMILHERHGEFHRYYVQDEQTTYQYFLDASKEKSLFPTLREFKRSISRALEKGELELYYQPVVSLRENKIVSIEAFIRWNHPQYGVIYPAEFISLAEEQGMIPDIDHWVIRQACQQLQAWHDFGVPLVPLSVNISTATLRHRNFVNSAIKTIQAMGVDSRYLQLEFNQADRSMVGGRMMSHLKRMRKAGVGLTLDNYATEQTNQISQISNLPIQSLKIDRSIIQRILEDYDQVRLISAVAKVAKSFQIKVIAQGVETQEQIMLLAEQDIEYAQGFLLGDPVRAQDMGWILGKSVDKEGRLLEG